MRRGHAVRRSAKIDRHPVFHIPIGDVEGAKIYRIIRPGMRPLIVTYSGQKETFWTEKPSAALRGTVIALSR